MSTTAEQRILISYRRSDSQSQANGLNDGLRHRLPNARVFMGIDSIPLGVDFEEHIREEIEQSHVALILIGDNWLGTRPGSDVRHIDEANDLVRLAVEFALAAEHLRVIPVLVEGATMPTPQELPESIQRLARLNAYEMSDQRWSADVDRLTAQLRELTSGTPAPIADSRGPAWPPPPPAYAPPPPPAYPPPETYARPRQAVTAPSGKKSRSVTAMILWCVLTFGLAAWTAPLWAASRRPHDKAFRKRMKVIATGLGVTTVAALTLVGASPEDVNGDPIGVASDIGGFLLLLSMAAGVAIVLLFKTPQVALPGVESVLVRRESRDRYRQLVEKDRPLALSMRVGRPDMQRDYDDGGLLDMNSLPLPALKQHGGLDDVEAAKIVEVRSQLGRYVSMDEVLAYVDLSESTATRLRDVAVFV